MTHVADRPHVTNPSPTQTVDNKPAALSDAGVCKPDVAVSDSYVSSTGPHLLDAEPSNAERLAMQRPNVTQQRVVERSGSGCGPADRVDTHRTPLLENATRVTLAPNETLRDRIRSHYRGQLSESSVALIEQATRAINGISQSGAMPERIGLLDIKDLARYFNAIDRRRREEGEPGPSETALERFGRQLPVAATPLPGHGYVARLDDDLRTLVLVAYGDELRKLPPEQLDCKVRELMAAVASANGLRALTLRGVIQLPAYEQAPSMIGAMERELLDKIVLAASDSAAALARLEAQPPRFGAVGEELGRVLGVARREIWEMRRVRIWEQSAAAGDFGFFGCMPYFGMVALNVCKELDEPPPPPPGQVAVQGTHESMHDFLTRLDPSMTPEEREAALRNPMRFYLERSGVIGSDGKVDAGKLAALRSSMQSIGLHEVEVEVRQQPEGGFEPVAQAVKRDLLAKLNETYPVVYQPDESFEAVLARMIGEHQAPELAAAGKLYHALLADFESKPGFGSAAVGPPYPGDARVSLGSLSIALGNLDLGGAYFQVAAQDVRKILYADDGIAPISYYDPTYSPSELAGEYKGSLELQKGGPVEIANLLDDRRKAEGQEARLKEEGVKQASKVLRREAFVRGSAKKRENNEIRAVELAENQEAIRNSIPDAPKKGRGGPVV